jgi:hypothetical protein
MSLANFFATASSEASTITLMMLSVPDARTTTLQNVISYYISFISYVISESLTISLFLTGILILICGNFL